MGDTNHCDIFFGESDHNVENFLNHLRVESGSRLIEEDQFLLRAERTGNRHTLLLTTGKVLRIGASLVGKTNALKIFHSRLFGFFFRNFLQLDRCQSQILENRHMWIQIELLEHHRGILSRHLTAVFLCHQLIVDVNLSGGRLL